MECPKWVPAFLERESRRRKFRPRTAAILYRASQEPTEANLASASQVLGNGSFMLG
jgi:hypothetical protein